MKKRIRIIIFLCLFPLACHHSVPETEEQLVLVQIQDRNGLSETVSAQERLASYKKVDFLSEQPYKKVLRIYRKEGKNRSIILTYHPNGTPWQLLEAKEMRAFGAFREWYPNGTRRIEATVIGGSADLTSSAQDTWLFDGLAQVWNENDQLIAAIPYEKGILSGISQSYYPSGAIEKKTPYHQDHQEGEAQEFWESGQIRATTSYVQGLRHGMSQGFWLQGNLSWEEIYDRGLLKNGLYWNPSAELVSEVKDGFGFRAVFKETVLFQLLEIRKGITEGMIKTFDTTGVLQCIYHLKNGRKHGEEIEYFAPRDVEGEQLLAKISLNWDQDALHGIIKTWYDNGQLQSQRELNRNKRSGPSCAWYRDSTLMLLEEYEEDLLVRGQYFRKNQRDPISTVTGGNGFATLYDADGIFLRKIQYSKGKILDSE